MAYTVDGLTDRVRNKLDDTSFSATKIREFLNDTNRYICHAHTWSFMEQTFSGAITSGEPSYALPADFEQAINLRITAPDDKSIFIPFMPFQEFDQLYPDPASAEDAQPTLWTRFGNNLILYPAPEQNYTMDLRYLKRPTELSDGSDVPDVPESFEELMVLGAYKRALEHEDNYDQAQAIAVQIDELLNQMSLRLNDRQIGVQSTLRTSRGRRTS